ncbi:hypothetical protein SDC9_212563 [bioreactor metagenome]|uniref:Uncharacterized protein n=1 Tax=bioreactor metagenome TaxID=1076179 RepID=A0A645JN20_9ZZZZ
MNLVLLKIVQHRLRVSTPCRHVKEMLVDLFFKHGGDRVGGVWGKRVAHKCGNHCAHLALWCGVVCVFDRQGLRDKLVVQRLVDQ